MSFEIHMPSRICVQRHRRQTSICDALSLVSQTGLHVRLLSLSPQTLCRYSACLTQVATLCLIQASTFSAHGLHCRKEKRGLDGG
jgi:hypothetical protein